MSKPAARMGDPTAHGGVIVIGFPTVLIGGMPAARIGDMHVCPMLNPGLPPPPHVGGPIALGSPTVLIGGAPAARMGDMAICAGPPDTIAMGCPTVLIGEAGSGSGSGGGGGGGGAAAANVGAATAQFDNLESVILEEHWVEIQFVDKAGLPVSGVSYKFTDTAGKVTEGRLRLDGRIRRDALADEGTCTVALRTLSQARWSRDTAKVGETVKLTAKVEGLEPDTPAQFQVFARDVKGPDRLVDHQETTVQGEQVEAEWVFEPLPDREVVLPREGATRDEGLPLYSAPVYYFEVIIGTLHTRSGLLHYSDTFEVEVVDENGKPLANQPYLLYLSSGEVREGTLGGGGELKLEDIPAGAHHLRLPELPALEAGE